MEKRGRRSGSDDVADDATNDTHEENRHEQQWPPRESDDAQDDREQDPAPCPDAHEPLSDVHELRVFHAVEEPVVPGEWQQCQYDRCHDMEHDVRGHENLLRPT